jgi:RimJ/RimL family protein N-acetyltransferase
MNIHGKKVVLRAPELRDAELLHKWANDPEIWKLLGGWHFPYGSASTEKWIASLGNNNLVNHVFSIETAEQGLIGTANLVNIDWKNKSAFHGMMLGNKEASGKGLGLDTVMAVMRYAFDELGLVRLDGDMVATNARSIEFYTKSCGWEIEGRKRSGFYREGKYVDRVIVGITQEGYFQLLKKNNYWG